MTWVMRLSKNGQAEKKGAMFMPEGTSDTKILITDEHGLLECVVPVHWKWEWEGAGWTTAIDEGRCLTACVTNQRKITPFCR